MFYFALNSEHPFVFRYIGPYPTQNPSIHGNSNSNKPYQRLSVRQKEVIASSLDKNQAPREIKDEIHAHIPEEPITLKTARNARYNYLKQKNPQDKQNLADDIITVLNKCYEDTSFVREVLTSTKNKPPNVILYSEEQMMSLRTSIKNGCIIGID